MGQFDLEGEVLTTYRQIDLSQLEAMAQTVAVVAEKTPASADVVEVLTDEADKYARRILGNSVLFFAGFYATGADGILYEARFFASLVGVRPTAFLDMPMEMSRRDWRQPGLGLVVEPQELVRADEADNDFVPAEIPLADIQGVGVMWERLTFPLNDNFIVVSNPILGSPEPAA